MKTTHATLVASLLGLLTTGAASGDEVPARSTFSDYFEPAYTFSDWYAGYEAPVPAPFSDYYGSVYTFSDWYEGPIAVGFASAGVDNRPLGSDVVSADPQAGGGAESLVHLRPSAE